MSSIVAWPAVPGTSAHGRPSGSASCSTGTTKAAVSPSGMLLSALSRPAGRVPAPMVWVVLVTGGGAPLPEQKSVVGAAAQRNDTALGGRGVCQPSADVMTDLMIAGLLGSGAACRAVLGCRARSYGTSPSVQV